jgi:hypothetical protein
MFVWESMVSVVMLVMCGLGRIAWNSSRSRVRSAGERCRCLTRMRLEAVGDR